MAYSEYFRKFCENDEEEVLQWIPNSHAEAFLLENAPRLYCPEPSIEETFAFRTWTMRKHFIHTEDGFLLTEFLSPEQLPWAGKHNTINCALTHHLNEFRWLKNADCLLDYLSFFLKGNGSSFSYHTPALRAMTDFCLHTGNEAYLTENLGAFEDYFARWEETHHTANGLYWSIDDREGTEYTISGTPPDRKARKGFRPLMNACMYADAIALAELETMAGRPEQAKHYQQKAQTIRSLVEEKMWDGSFFKAIHPDDGDLDRPLDFQDIPEACNARELMGYIPWCFGLPSEGKEEAFLLLKDPAVFLGKTGLTTADISHPRFLYYPERACTWSGLVWPYATSYLINAVITLLNCYHQTVLADEDLYRFLLHYTSMHYAVENGKRINFIDEAMLPFDHVWYVREMGKRSLRPFAGGRNRGRDYNHSTYIDLVLRGLCGIGTDRDGSLTVAPRIRGIWKWFRLENLTIHNHTYNVFYDEDGSVFGKGVGIHVEKLA